MALLTCRNGTAIWGAIAHVWLSIIALLLGDSGSEFAQQSPRGGDLSVGRLVDASWLLLAIGNTCGVLLGDLAVVGARAEAGLGPDNVGPAVCVDVPVGLGSFQERMEGREQAHNSARSLSRATKAPPVPGSRAQLACEVVGRSWLCATAKGTPRSCAHHGYAEERRSGQSSSAAWIGWGAPRHSQSGSAARMVGSRQ